MREGAQIPANIVIIVLFNIIINIIISTLAFLLLTTELYGEGASKRIFLQAQNS